MIDFFSAPAPRFPERYPAPKYLTICRAITEGIEAGTLRPGDALPSQKQMADYFGVTLMTMRQALRLLAEQGLLTVEHGRGTFVAERAYRLALVGLSSFVSQIADAGRSLNTRVIEAKEMPTPHGVRARMGIEAESVFCITRLRSVDDVPLVYSMSLLSTELGNRLKLDSLADHSLYDVLAMQLGIVVTRAVESFHAGAIGAEEAASLDCTVGSPALISSRLTYTADGAPVVDDRAIMPGDGVQISVERHIGDVDLSIDLHHNFPASTASSPISQEIHP